MNGWMAMDDDAVSDVGGGALVSLHPQKHWMRG